MDSVKIYKLAESMTNAEYKKKYSKLTEKQKLSVQSLIRLGDTPKLALATILLNKDNGSENSDTWKLYTMKDGGGVGEEFYVGQSIMLDDKKPHFRRLTKDIQRLVRPYYNVELVIEEIIPDKPYNFAKTFVKSNGEKVPFEIKLNKKQIQQYAKGGAMTKKLGLGGRVTNINDATATSDLKDELRSKMKKGDDIIHFAFTDYGGDFMDKVAIEYFEENYPKNTLSETTAYYGKNAFVFGKPATEWLEASEDYPLGFEDFESYYYEKQNEQENEDFERFLDDLKRDGYDVSDEAMGWLNENRGGYYGMTTQGLDFSYEDLTDDLKKEGLITKDKMAEGGSTKGFNYSIGGL